MLIFQILFYKFSWANKCYEFWWKNLKLQKGLDYGGIILYKINYKKGYLSYDELYNKKYIMGIIMKKDIYI